jgi:hypothetical protein
MLKVLAREHLQRLLTSKRKLNRTGISRIIGICVQSYISKILKKIPFYHLFAISGEVPFYFYDIFVNVKHSKIKNFISKNYG